MSSGIDHYWCERCTPDGSVAMCGHPLEPDSEPTTPEEEGPMCVMCEHFNLNHVCKE